MLSETLVDIFAYSIYFVVTPGNVIFIIKYLN